MFYILNLKTKATPDQFNWRHCSPIVLRIGTRRVAQYCLEHRAWTTKWKKEMPSLTVVVFGMLLPFFNPCTAETSVYPCRDLLGKTISGKIGPNLNSNRVEETHRARDRDNTSSWAS
ncbi:hypothetical protein VPH35_065719 [Triticum aestivum]